MALPRMAIFSLVTVLVLALSYVSGDDVIDQETVPPYFQAKANCLEILGDSQGKKNLPGKGSWENASERLRRHFAEEAAGLLKPIPEDAVTQMQDQIQARGRGVTRPMNALQGSDSNIMNPNITEENVTE